ncbi:DUF3270 family protein [Lactococcus garvieae]|uniref:DUF3270 family protein n=1 Tax=Lactococcus garvieae DCC43 TaxID=1231377 RepID=K2QFX5_9LACT|nr:DUF3270 family protein [Lactococcus garvieae]EKF52422.1 hypothetical protein C426_0304 [Lactococcus garvieae DCC43]QPS70597.1 DUF3270 family protein [Lactococcus garvieae]
MELKNLNDFYEKQEYYSYDELNSEESHLTKRVHELTFFLNVASFSVIMAMMMYLFITVTSSLVAVPAALLVGFVVFLICKKGIKKLVHLLMK